MEFRTEKVQPGGTQRSEPEVSFLLEESLIEVHGARGSKVKEKRDEKQNEHFLQSRVFSRLTV